MDRNESLDPVMLVRVFDYDRLDDVVHLAAHQREVAVGRYSAHVVDDGLLDLFAEVDDSSALGRVLDGVAVSVERGKGLLVLLGADVTLWAAQTVRRDGGPGNAPPRCASGEWRAGG
jgi:hypothetical protein